MFDQDQTLAERIATAKDSDVDIDQAETIEAPHVAPESKGERYVGLPYLRIG